MVLSSDNKFELIKVNIDNKDSLLKKLMRQEKRKTLKRKRDDVEEAEVDEDAIKDVKVDKEKLLLQIEESKYDLSLHFSKKLAFELD